MSKYQNDKMAKWPNGAIEGVNVLKVIPRPTALRAVGKNDICIGMKYVFFFDFSDFFLTKMQMLSDCQCGAKFKIL
jgi:hypothetical protein